MTSIASRNVLTHRGACVKDGQQLVLHSIVLESRIDKSGVRVLCRSWVTVSVCDDLQVRVDLQNAMTIHGFAIDYDCVHKADPLSKVLSNGNLRLVDHGAPVRVRLADREDATVSHAEVRA